MTTNYGAEIRKLDREYVEITGRSVFQGVEHRGSSAMYLFSDESFYSGPDALDHMRELLRLVQK